MVGMFASTFLHESRACLECESSGIILGRLEYPSAWAWVCFRAGSQGEDPNFTVRMNRLMRQPDSAKISRTESSLDEMHSSVVFVQPTHHSLLERGHAPNDFLRGPQEIHILQTTKLYGKACR